MPARRRLVSPEDNARFGRFLQSLREEQGLTQRALATRLGVHQSYVAKVELGERQIPTLEFVFYCAALRQKPADVLAQFLANSE